MTATDIQVVDPAREKKLKDTMNRAKMRLMTLNNMSFITHVVYQLIHQYDDSIPTACTDGKYVKYNPDFWLSLSPGVQIFVVLHEAWHVVLKHCGAIHSSRAHGKDPRRFNIAADHVINLMLKDAGVDIWEHACCDPQYADLSTEEVYNLLPPMTEDQATKMLAGMGDIQAPDDATDPSKVDDAAHDIIIKAAISARMSGNAASIPGNVTVLLDALNQPTQPWYKLLSRYVKSRAKVDYSYAKFNRRYFPEHYIPTLYSESLGNIALIFDMSCSVQDHEIKQFASETYQVLSKLKPSLLSLVQFDTSVFKVDELKKASDFHKVSFHGRGGTDINPAMQWALDNKPDVAVVFTDGYFYGPNIDPKVPVVWLIHDNPQWTAPFGKVIHYDIPYPTN